MQDPLFIKTNKASLLETLNLIILSLKGLQENHFKIAAFEKAYKTISSWAENELQEKFDQTGCFIKIPGIGAGIGQVLTELAQTGQSQYAEGLQKQLPEGFFEVTKIRGLGPSKAMAICQHLGIKGLRELMEACQSKQLRTIPGFSEKSESTILTQIHQHFYNATRKILSDACLYTNALLTDLKATFPDTVFEVTGDIRRCMETVDTIELLIVTPSSQAEIEAFLSTKTDFLPLITHFVSSEQKAQQLFETTGPASHVKEVYQLVPPSFLFPYSSEQSLYAAIGWPLVTPPQRDLITITQPPLQEIDIIVKTDITGVFHVHTDASDGVHSLEEMVQKACQLGYQYLGISDHSQSAFYAGGLSPSDCYDQKHAIKNLQSKYPNMTIFWGIESDILKDGSLDYPDDLLMQFDFVISSIHSRFSQNSSEITERLKKAVENPFTTFLGHPSGRVLLARPAYEFDFETIIQSAAKKGVAIELNCSESRLDFDWRYGPLFTKHHCLTSLNPDAHSKEGYDSLETGLFMAQKSLISKDQFVNTRPLAWIKNWLQSKKQHILSPSSAP